MQAGFPCRLIRPQAFDDKHARLRHDNDVRHKQRDEKDCAYRDDNQTNNSFHKYPSCLLFAFAFDNDFNARN